MSKYIVVFYKNDLKIFSNEFDKKTYAKEFAKAVIKNRNYFDKYKLIRVNIKKENLERSELYGRR
jgi:hypothetical protein